MADRQTPNTLLEAIRYFDDIDVCTEYVASLRWPDGWVCPNCDSTEYSYLTTRRLWKCKACKKQTSVKVGTIFEDSALSLSKWLPAIWLVANRKNGVSSHELARSLGITQKSAWFVLHRIRLAMQIRGFDRFDGTVEVDETFVGGRSSNMHKHNRKRKQTKVGMPGSNKTIVAGTLQRRNDEPSQVQTAVLPDIRRASLHHYIHSTVEPGATMYTDRLRSYEGLDGLGFDHDIINHATEYVRHQVHTNGIENFWSLVKRGLHGTYVSVNPAHLFRYLDERVFTYNLRQLTDLGRFTAVLHTAAGRRLTYAELTGQS